jgi:nicotinamide-nucleotide amidase
MVTPEEEAGGLLRAHGLTLAVAESCTGGLISHRITNIPGASDYYLAGFVTYSNEAKRLLLGVSDRALADHGAVSAQVAEQMAAGARRTSGADVAVAVTGIAGPGGGTPEKPVGTVFMAVAGPGGTVVRHHWFSGDRRAIKEATADGALRLVCEYLGGTTRA